MLLLGQRFWQDRRLAQGANLFVFKPFLQAHRVEDVSLVAVEGYHLVTHFVLLQANDALICELATLGVLLSVETLKESTRKRET